MKKIISLLLLSAILVSLCACGNEQGATEPSATEPLIKDEIKMSPEELRGKLVIGLLHHTQYPEFTYQYTELIRKLAEEREANE